eukprot:1531264-Karenia_brevis.AAC.1
MMTSMKSVMREVMREELGEGLKQVSDKVDELKSEIDAIKTQATRAGETASAAMEAVRALKSEVAKEMQGFAEAAHKGVGKGVGK